MREQLYAHDKEFVLESPMPSISLLFSVYSNPLELSLYPPIYAPNSQMFAVLGPGSSNVAVCHGSVLEVELVAPVALLKWDTEQLNRLVCGNASFLHCPCPCP